MNKIEIEGIITRTKDFTDALGIMFMDNMFNKISRYATTIKGAQLKKWNGKLQEGNVVAIQGNIAETKTMNSCSYIVIYNPEIIDAFRMVSEKISLTTKGSDISDGSSDQK